ncbi:hypothetical protein ACFC5T_17005 [Streptomyces sp. NPDC055961]|uniref:hypothetical protein n=1 Tax=Streptomyces sp. NPDC055961 TaxID=3345666 RepID=UPI0035DBA43E
MFDYRAHLFPADEADLGSQPHELSPARALAELRDALAGWIAETVEPFTDHAFNPDREHGGHIAMSLFEAVRHLRTTSDSAALRTATILEHAAVNTLYAANLARRHGSNQAPYGPTDLSTYVRSSYAAAVSAVRQAHAAAATNPCSCGRCPAR